jgi:flagellar motor switch protein FliN/FliY
VMMPTDTLAKLSTETASADADATPEESRPATAPAAAPSRGVASDIENIDLILDVQLSVVARLGQVEMPISEVLALGAGAIIEVGRSVEEPVELFVNEKLIARGEVVVVDEKFGLRITEIVSPSDRVKSLR